MVDQVRGKITTVDGTEATMIEDPRDRRQGQMENTRVGWRGGSRHAEIFLASSGVRRASRMKKQKKRKKKEK